MFDITTYNKLAEECIVEAPSGVFYLDPLWRAMLDENEEKATPELFEALKLTVEKKNAEANKVQGMVESLFEFFDSSRSALNEEERILVDKMLDYMWAQDPETAKRATFGAWDFRKK